MLAAEIIPFPSPRHAPCCRVLDTLDRRIAACDERRREAALSPGNDEDFAAWCRECDRGNKLRFARLRFFDVLRHHTRMTSAPTMSHKLTPARQSALLSRYHYLDNNRLRVQCVLATEPLLKLAGVHHPQPFEFYPIPVRRDESGFLVIETAPCAPQSESDSELFAPGGIFAGSVQPEGRRTSNITDHRAEIPLQFFSELRETMRVRRFEIATGPHSKVRVEIVAFDDHALPSPMEPERWKPRDAADKEVREVAQALALAPSLPSLER